MSRVRCRSRQPHRYRGPGVRSGLGKVSRASHHAVGGLLVKSITKSLTLSLPERTQFMTNFGPLALLSHPHEPGQEADSDAKPPHNRTFLRNVRYRNGRQCPNPERQGKLKNK